MIFVRHRKISFYQNDLKSYFCRVYVFCEGQQSKGDISSFNGNKFYLEIESFLLKDWR